MPQASSAWWPRAAADDQCPSSMGALELFGAVPGAAATGTTNETRSCNVGRPEGAPTMGGRLDSTGQAGARHARLELGSARCAGARPRSHVHLPAHGQRTACGPTRHAHHLRPPITGARAGGMMARRRLSCCRRTLLSLRRTSAWRTIGGRSTPPSSATTYSGADDARSRPPAAWGGESRSGRGPPRRSRRPGW